MILSFHDLHSSVAVMVDALKACGFALFLVALLDTSLGSMNLI